MGLIFVPIALMGKAGQSNILEDSMKKHTAVTLISACIFAVTAIPLMAQTPNPQWTHGAQSPHGVQQQRAFHLPGERVEAQLAYLKTALKITDAQLSQWNAYADMMRKQAAAMDTKIKAMHTEGAQHTERRQHSAIDRLERQQQFLAAAAARLNERIAVEKPLYAVLTDEQKHVADQVLAPRRGPGMFNPRERRRMT
jgi:hypothetical protein